MMKIAYVNEEPGQIEWNDFINDYTDKMHKTDDLSWGRANNEGPCYVIAAYDNELLVAIGYLSVDSTGPQLDSSIIHVLPAYRHRGIEITMQKLLLAEWKFSPLPMAR